MNWLLRQIAADPRAFRALLHASVRMDLRSQHYRRATRAGESKLFTPLFWVLAQNVFISFVCAVVLFGRVDLLTFSTLTIGVSMVLVAAAVVVEFHEVVLNPDDAAVLAHLPVTPRTYAAVRLTKLLAYVALLGVSLNVCPAVVGAWLSDGGLEFAPVYLVVAGAADVMAAGATIIAYIAFARVLGARGVKDALAYAQIAVTLAAVYGIQLLRTSGFDETQRFIDKRPAWLAWTPPAWFASGVATLAWLEPSEHLGLAVVALALFVLVAWLALWLLTGQYARVPSGSELLGGAGRVAARGASAVSWTGGFWSAVCGTREEAAAARFCWIVVCRDHDLKMRSIPSAGAALGFLLIGSLMGQLVDPFGAAAGQDVAASIVIPYFLVMAVPIVANNLLLSREHRAAWLFHCSPIASPAATVWGMCRVIEFAMVLPVLVLLFVGFSLLWRAPLHAGVHCLAALLVCFITLRCTAAALLRDWPFSQKYVPGAVSGRTIVFVAFVMGAATFVGIAQMHAYRSVRTLVGFLFVLSAVAGLVSWWTRRRVELRVVNGEFCSGG